MDESILQTIKKMLGIMAKYTYFDTDIKIHINSVLATLNQLGVGTKDAFHIEDDSATWGDFLDDENKLNNVQTYMYMKVRLIFDPPASTAVIEAYKEFCKELEFRLTVAAEEVSIDGNAV